MRTELIDPWSIQKKSTHFHLQVTQYGPVFVKSFFKMQDARLIYENPWAQSTFNLRYCIKPEVQNLPHLTKILKRKKKIATIYYLKFFESLKKKKRAAKKDKFLTPNPSQTADRVTLIPLPFLYKEKPSGDTAQVAVISNSTIQESELPPTEYAWIVPTTGYLIAVHSSASDLMCFDPKCPERVKPLLPEG